jgi:tetratricopeptide (TPR) repeat protein
MFGSRREQGRLKELAPLVRHFAQTTPKESTWRPGLALIYAELDLLAEARSEFESLAQGGFAAVPEDGSWVNSMRMLAEVCCLLGDGDRAQTLYDLLSPYASCNVLIPPFVGCYGVASRQLGMLATTMRRWEEAERHFESALELNQRQGGRPWVAHSQEQYARMLSARGRTGDDDRVAALLDRALATGRELGMRALEERITAGRAGRTQAGASY